MDLLQHIEGNTLVVRVLAPRLDATSAPLLRRRIEELIRDGRSRLVLDISNVESIDSNGLRTLVFALKRLGSHQDLAISGAQGGVMNMLKLTRLYQLFNIFPNSEQAIAALRS